MQMKHTKSPTAHSTPPSPPLQTSGAMAVSSWGWRYSPGFRSPCRQPAVSFGLLPRQKYCSRQSLGERSMRQTMTQYIFKKAQAGGFESSTPLSSGPLGPFRPSWSWTLGYRCSTTLSESIGIGDLDLWRRRPLRGMQQRSDSAIGLLVQSLLDRKNACYWQTECNSFDKCFCYSSMFQGHEKHKSNNPLDGMTQYSSQDTWIRSYNNQVRSTYPFSVLLLGSNPPNTTMNYVWSMTNAQAKLQVCFRDTQLLLKPMCNTHTQDYKYGRWILSFTRAVLPWTANEWPAPNIYTVCPLEVQMAVIASCEHRWPERAMGSQWNVKFNSHGPSTRFLVLGISL